MREMTNMFRAAVLIALVFLAVKCHSDNQAHKYETKIEIAPG